MQFVLCASLECGALAPLWYNRFGISCQSGAKAPHSKEAHNLQAGMNLDRRIFAKQV